MCINEEGRFDINFDHNLLLNRYASSVSERICKVKNKKNWYLKNADWEKF